MTESEHPLSQKEFTEIYSKVPRLTVEVVVKGSKGIYLTKRDIEPCKGMWHLPGGTVKFGEKLTDTVFRTAKRELGIDVTVTSLLGYIEYPSHYEKGLDSPVGIVFLVKTFSGTIKTNFEASDGGWFEKLPENMHEEQINFLSHYFPGQQ
jgi:ADP-ribose pyrophosphatase YjhB (NUDIX family)